VTIAPNTMNIYRLWEWKGLPWLLIGLGFVLRLTNLDATSLWMDEIYSLMVANGHVTPAKLPSGIQTAEAFYQQHLAWQPLTSENLLAALKINVHMPFYYLLLNPWLGWLGNDAIGLRSFSAIFSTLMLIPLYFLGKTLGGPKAGLWTLMVAAFAPFQIYYGQEGRMYALSLFWCALSGLTFWKTLYADKPLKWSLFYALSTTAGLATHYMFVFYLAFHAVYGLFWLTKYRDFKRFSLFGFALMAMGMFIAWWIPIYQIQQQGMDEEYHFAKGMVGWLRYLTTLVWQPLVVIAGDNEIERLFFMHLTAVLFLTFLLKRDTQKRFEFSFQRDLFLLMWILLPLLLQIGYDILKQTHTTVIDRYAMLISPGVCLWLGLSLDRLDKQRMSKAILKPAFRNLPVILTGLMFLLAVCNVWYPSPFRDEHNKDKDIRQKFRYMAQNAQPGDLVFANGPWGAALIAAYYLHRERPAQPMIYWISHHRGKTVPLPKLSLFEPYPRTWLFRNRANNERGLQQAKEYLQAQYLEHTQTQDWFIYWTPVR
jgi:uncharacterized membrane protein